MVLAKHQRWLYLLLCCVKYCECYKAAEESESRRSQGVLVEESHKVKELNAEE